MTFVVIKLRLYVPFRILKELVDVFTEHLLKILILQPLFAACLTLVAHVLDLCCAVCLVRSRSASRTARYTAPL